MIHPDIQDAMEELVAEHVGIDHVYNRLTVDFHDRLPAVLVTAEQKDMDYLSTHRCVFEFYDSTPSGTRNLARKILNTLVDGAHGTTAGLIDSVRIETNLKETPYTEKVSMYSASVFVDTRGI